MRARVLLAGLVAGSAWACAIPLYKHGIDDCPVTTMAAGDRVTVQFLGVGGFLISHGSDVVLTAPLYSNPSLVEYLLDHEIRTDGALVDRLLPPAAKSAKAIIVGHSHYDHLLDAPYVAINKTSGAKIYGSETTKNLLDSIAAKLAAAGSGVVSMDKDAHVPGVQKGEWVPIPGTHVWLMAVQSEHSDQVVAKVPLGPTIPLHLGRGKVTEPAKKVPRTPSQWAEGTVFSYVIDFRDASDTQTLFRVYYQDSGTNEPVGFLPEHVKNDGKAVDLAILCVGGAFDRLDTHPAGILLDTRPRFALLAHWEDFFVPQPSYCVNDRSTDEDDRGIPGIPGASAKFLGRWRKSDTERFLDLVDQAIQRNHLPTRAWLPCPTWSRFELPLSGDAQQPTAGLARGCPH